MTTEQENNQNNQNEEDFVPVSEQEYLEMLPGDMGLEGITFRDLKTAFFSIIQANAPERKKPDPRYMEDCDVGDIIDRSTKELYDGEEGLLFIPLKHIKLWVEWVPRTKGGGYVATYDRPLPTNKDFELANGNKLNETSYFIGWMIIRNTKTLCIIPMDRTNLTVAKDFLTMIFNEKDNNGQKRPMGYRIFKVCSALTHKKGHSWMAWFVKKTKGTIVAWANKQKLDLREIARDAREINRDAMQMFQISDPPKELMGVAPMKQIAAQEAEVVEDEDDEPF